MKKIVSTSDAPAAIGPYSQAIRSGSMLFCAGQIPLDPKTGQIVSDDISEQAKRVLENISAILRAEHLNFEHVVKTTIFLTSMGDFQAVNEIYATYFRENPPARSTVAVSALPKGAKVEIEVIAVASDSPRAARPSATPRASIYLLGSPATGPPRNPGDQARQQIAARLGGAFACRINGTRISHGFANGRMAREDGFGIRSPCSGWW